MDHPESKGMIYKDIKDIMIEFAKLHVQEALRQASEKAETDYELDNPYDANSAYYIVNKDSILNAYSLDTIK
mgnify:FL=1